MHDLKILYKPGDKFTKSKERQSLM